MYSYEQRILIAREFMRAGGSIPRTMDALRQNYESFPTICESTIRKLRANGVFRALVEQHKEILHEARQTTALETEKINQRCLCLQANPVRQGLVDTVTELKELAKTSRDPKIYKVLIHCYDLLGRMDREGGTK